MGDTFRAAPKLACISWIMFVGVSDMILSHRVYSSMASVIIEKYYRCGFVVAMKAMYALGESHFIGNFCQEEDGVIVFPFHRTRVLVDRRRVSLSLCPDLDHPFWRVSSPFAEIHCW